MCSLFHRSSAVSTIGTKKSAGNRFGSSRPPASNLGVQSVREIFNHYVDPGIATEIMGAS
jgi:hypothetical protein